MAVTTTNECNNDDDDDDDEYEEPFGTTAIPTGSYSIRFNVDNDTEDGVSASASASASIGASININANNNNNNNKNLQQPQTQPIAVYEASKNSTLDPLIHLNGNLIDVNPQFVVYTVKNGLIRVMHRHSAMRALLRGHQHQKVTDIRFFHDGDVLGTVGTSTGANSTTNGTTGTKNGTAIASNATSTSTSTSATNARSTLIVWRVYERSPEICSERLLEISTGETANNAAIAADLTLSRLVWHPFDPNQFWMTHSTTHNKQVATLVETTRIRTKLVTTATMTKAHNGSSSKGNNGNGNGNGNGNKPTAEADQTRQHALCRWHSPSCVVEHAIQLRVDAGTNSNTSNTSNASNANANANANTNTNTNTSNDAQLVDLCWSGRDARHVLSVHKNGTIVLWDLKGKGEDDTNTNDTNGSHAAATTTANAANHNATNHTGEEDSSIVPCKLFALHEPGVEHSRCLFLPHEQSVAVAKNGNGNGNDNNDATTPITTCFVTASNRNSTVTIWSAFLQRNTHTTTHTTGLVLPTKLQEISLFPNNLPRMGIQRSFVLDVCYGPADLNHLHGKRPPPSSFLVLGSRDTGRLYALHVKAEWSGTNSNTNTNSQASPLCAGVDYMVPFALKHPVYSWSVVCGPTEDNDDGLGTSSSDSIHIGNGIGKDGPAFGSGFDMKAFAYQSKAVQCLTVTSSMTLPPVKTYDGNSNSNAHGLYQVQPLRGPYVATAAAAASMDANDATETETRAKVEVEPPTATATEYEYEYDEEDYDIEDIDDNGEVDNEQEQEQDVAPVSVGAVAPAAIPLGLFPGTTNPFANWLGAIAASEPTNNNDNDNDAAATDDDDDDLPTPPAPSDLPMPPGIVVAPAVGTGGARALAPPAHPDGVVLVPAATEDFLNPLELLAKSMSGEQPTVAVAPSTSNISKTNKSGSNNINININNNKANGTSKKHNNNNTKSPHRSGSPKRSQSNKKGNKPQNNNNNNNNNNSLKNNPFPDGKVTILKRDPDSAVAPSASLPLSSSVPAPPLPADPSVSSDPAPVAGIPVPVHPAAALPTPAIPMPSAANTITTAQLTIDPEVLRQHVHEAVEQAVSDLVVPTVRTVVRDAVSVAAQPLHDSMESLAGRGVSVDRTALAEVLDVEAPLRAAFAEGLKTVLVPALQSITGRVLQQVRDSAPKPPKPIPPPPPAPDHSEALAKLARQLVVVTSNTEALATEVRALRKTVAEQAAAARAQHAAASRGAGPGRSNHHHHHNANNNANANANHHANAQADGLAQIRNEVDQLLAKELFEQAFTKAVATTTPQVAVYCCARSDIERVVSGPSLALSQPILICLMQQLSAAMAGAQTAQELGIELKWLQEIALTMNPRDPSIAPHVSKVVGQLVATVKTRMELTENAGPFRRPLQMLLQSLRGMQDPPK